MAVSRKDDAWFACRSQNFFGIFFWSIRVTRNNHTSHYHGVVIFYSRLFVKLKKTRAFVTHHHHHHRHHYSRMMMATVSLKLITRRLTGTRRSSREMGK